MDLPTGDRMGWGALGQSHQLLLWRLGRLWGKAREHSSHTDHPGAATWPLLEDFLLVSVRKKSQNVEFTNGSLRVRLGDIQVERGWAKSENKSLTQK